MSQNLHTFLKIDAKVNGVEHIEQLKRKLNETGSSSNQASQGFNRLSQETQHNQQRLEQLKHGLGGVKTGILALVGAMASMGLGASAILKTADDYVNLTAKVKMATEQTGNFTQAMSGIHQVALATNSNLEETANLFTKLNSVGQEMGMSTKQAIDLTKTVTQAIQLGGSSAEGASAAVTQFIQAMNGGVLRGEEFNSIMENGFGLADALARGLGVTTGELRKMAEAGELSSERVIKAISSQSQAIEQQYAKLPTTIDNALQRIKTQWQTLIGEFDQANGGSSAVAQFLVQFADGLGELKTLLDDVGSGFSWVNDRLQNIQPETLHALKSAVTESYEMVKNLISAFAGVGETAIDSINSALDMFLPFGQVFDNGTQQVTGFQKAINALRFVIGTLSDGVNGINIGFKLLAGGIQTVTASVVQMQAKITSVINEQLGNDLQRMADNLFANAKKNFDGAEQLALNFKSQAVAVWDDIHKTQEQRDAEHLANAKAKMSELLSLNQQEVESKKISEQEKLQAVQQYATLAVQANKGVIDGTMQADLLAKGYIVTLDSAGKVAVETAQKVQNATQNQQKIIDDARKSATALGVDLDVSLNRVSEKFQANAQHLDKLSQGLDGLGAKGEQVGNTMYTAWQKMLESAKNQAEIDLAKQKLHELEKQGVFSTKQVEQGLLAIREANRKIPSELSETEKAFERLGIKTKEQLKLASDLALADFEKVRTSGQATAEQLQQAYERVLKTAEMSGNAQAVANAKAQGAMAGIQQQAEQTGQSIQQSMNNASQSVNRLSQTAYNATGGFDALGQSADEATAKAEQAIEKANEAGQASRELGGKLGTTSNTYYNVAGIASQLKNMGYDDDQAYAKAQQIFKQASQQMMDWAGSNNTLRQLASNTVNNHGVTAEAMYRFMQQAEQEAAAMKAQKAEMDKLQNTLQQLQSSPTNSVNVADFSNALNDIVSKAEAKGGQQLLKQLIADLKRQAR